MDSVVNLALNCRVPLQRLLDEANKTDQHICKHRLYSQLEEETNMDSIYGKLISVLEIPSDSGQVMKAEFIDPSALLCWMAATSLHFFVLCSGV